MCLPQMETLLRKDLTSAGMTTWRRLEPCRCPITPSNTWVQAANTQLPFTINDSVTFMLRQNEVGSKCWLNSA